jgi:hypothetical protein
VGGWDFFRSIAVLISAVDAGLISLVFCAHGAPPPRPGCRVMNRIKTPVDIPGSFNYRRLHAVITLLFHAGLNTHRKKKKLRRFANTIAQITNARSINISFYKLKTIDDNKKIIPHLAIDTELFHSTFEFLDDVKPKAHLERCAPYCAFGHKVPNGQLLYEMAQNL